MSIEEFKEIWRSSDLEPKVSMNDMIHIITKGNMKSTLQKLCDFYRRIGILASIMLLLPWQFYYMSLGGSMDFNWFVPILWEALSLLSAVNSFILYRKLKKIDVVNMNITEVFDRIKKCRKFHIIDIMCNLPIAVLFLIAMALSANDISFVYGMITGAVVGLIVGIRMLVKVLGMYRSLINDSKDLLED